MHADFQSGSQRSLRTVGVVSSSDGEGASSVAANVAITSARSYRKSVLLIDANTLHPSIDSHFDVNLAPGLTEAVLGNADPSECIQETQMEKLRVMTTGEPQRHLAFDLGRVASMLEEMKEHFGLIVLDLPPATQLSSVYGLAGLLDGVLLVVESERTRIDAAQRAKDSLVRANANLLGVIFNKQQTWLPKWLQSIG